MSNQAKQGAQQATGVQRKKSAKKSKKPPKCGCVYSTVKFMGQVRPETPCYQPDCKNKKWYKTHGHMPNPYPDK
ncbi:hypothetical protein PMZ80_008486 [Knufia obscura]|nr:hypothetical protein PMZ80_008486 [Knufia obscura]